MPRQMPPLYDEFNKAIDSALNLITAIEIARVYLSNNSSNISLFHLELSYELAYLRLFNAWEVFLEQSFYRYLCGYISGGIREIPVANVYCQTLIDAENMVLGNRSYILWHNPTNIIGRAQTFLINSRHENVISSMQTTLERYASIRHRIAHSQSDAMNNFDSTTLSLAGRRYRGSRPGRFLRDWVPNNSYPERWILKISNELKGLANQIVS